MKYATLTQINPPKTENLEQLARDHRIQFMGQKGPEVSHNTFNLDGNTVLGRSETMSDEALFQLWKKRLGNRAEHSNPGVGADPISFQVLQQFYQKKTLDLKITDGPNISRRHLLFCIPDGNVESYYAVDLFSRNGTMINNEFLSPGIPRLLYHGDLIMLPHTYNGWITFQLKEIEKVTTYEGIMIANPDGTLPGNEADARILKPLLKERGFNLDLLMGNVTREEVFKTIESRAGKLSSSSYLLFMYLGHGSAQGELCLSDGKIPVRELYQKLENIRAKKMLIFDCCYGGNYLQNIPSNSAVAVSTKRFEVAYSGIFTKGLIENFAKTTAGMYFEDLISRVCHSVEFQLEMRTMEPSARACSVIYFRTVPQKELERSQQVYQQFVHGTINPKKTAA